MIDTLDPTDVIEQAEVFQIDSDQRAEWLLRKLASIDAEKARVKAQAEAILKSLDADKERLQHLFGSQLESYCRTKLQRAGNRKKTLHFLQGTCAFRLVPAGVKVTDLSSALAWSRDYYPDAIKTVQTLDTTAYRNRAEKALQHGEELLPGCETAPEHEVFNIRFGKD